ncbi:HAD family hydrolase [Streptomyces sp. NPDC048603]|uniref:HAD family hydrolase n=1 Tax=Streptomyces sp. NPDC048603 TaxID=3365577 RepID=UPI00371C7F1C
MEHVECGATPAAEQAAHGPAAYAVRAALFDVDGTLTDTNHLHVVSWWEAFRQAGHDITMHAVHQALGLPGPDLLVRLLGPGHDQEEKDAISTAHDVLYATYFERITAIPRAGDLLHALASDGWRIVLVTSASGEELSALRRAIDADDALHATTSADDVEHGKPHPEPVCRALELAGALPGRAVFVGDSVWDMEAGRRASVNWCVGLLCGGIPAADLQAAGADAVHEDPAELLHALGTSPFARIPA